MNQEKINRINELYKKQGKKQRDCKTTIYIGRISKSRGGFVISIISLRSGNDGNESENS